MTMENREGFSSLGKSHSEQIVDIQVDVRHPPATSDLAGRRLVWVFILLYCMHLEDARETNS